MANADRREKLARFWHHRQWSCRKGRRRFSHSSLLLVSSTAWCSTVRIAKADSGGLFGFGRRNWNQYLAAGLDPTNVAIDGYDFPKQCAPLQSASRLTHIAAGHTHTVYVLDGRQVFCTGFNYYGQCGASNMQHEVVERYFEVEVPLDPHERVAQVAAGFNHNLLLTSTGRVFFWGNVTQNQLPGFKDKFGSGLVFSGPILVDLPLQDKETVVRVKATFNRNLAFLDSGRVIAFGGEDLTFYHGLPSLGYLDLSEEFSKKDLKITDAALGLWHSVVITEPKTK